MTPAIENDNTKVNLFLIDDHPVVLEGLRSFFIHYPWINIVGFCQNGLEAVEKLKFLEVDIVLLDMGLPEISGVKIAEKIQSEKIPVKILAYTMYNDPEYLKILVSIAVHGYLLKDSPVEELIHAIRQVAKGNIYYSPTIAGGLLRNLIIENPNKKTEVSKTLPTNALTSREREVLLLVTQGLKNREIAEQLSLNPRTAETHRRNIMSKLGIHSTAGLTRYVIESNFK
jgi:DNA-binding NarL/FixJ family response regulator